MFPHHWGEHHFPTIIWNLSLACLHAGVEKSVWLAYRQVPSFPRSASTDITSWGDSTGCDVGRGEGVPRPAVTDHVPSLVIGVLLFPHQYLTGCLWSSCRRQKGNIPMTGHTVLSGGSPRFDCHHCRVGFVRDMGPCIWGRI